MYQMQARPVLELHKRVRPVLSQRLLCRWRHLQEVPSYLQRVLRSRPEKLYGLYRLVRPDSRQSLLGAVRSVRVPPAKQVLRQVLPFLCRVFWSDSLRVSFVHQDRGEQTLDLELVSRLPVGPRDRQRDMLVLGADAAHQALDEVHELAGLHYRQTLVCRRVDFLQATGREAAAREAEHHSGRDEGDRLLELGAICERRDPDRPVLPRVARRDDKDAGGSFGLDSTAKLEVECSRADILEAGKRV